MIDKGRVVMTLRVSRDSGRTWSERAEYRTGELAPDGGSSVYPPCECPRCRPSAGPALTKAISTARRKTIP